ncbi:MAG: 1,3-beta-galactosyl-N-acetylhexosamine phosphorylase [Treponema sp.]|nr:1,3-beta-galactosyl-N-acetylhexosamine phosphorylase [Treponema sp.]
MNATQKDITKGDFTLPGEAGFEALTLKMAKKWGADIIRDSDGTKLSPEITKAGYGIYSTICIIRADNEWAKNHTDCLQQNFLMSKPVIAESNTVTIKLLDGYFKEQFIINKKDDPKEFWQVFDRTTGKEVALDSWTFNPDTDSVTVNNIVPYHRYTVNFLAVRIWEEISMYNHVTNHWNKEHLMAIDPVYPEAMEHFKNWMQNWCENNPDTTVVRFTSMFYNFAWFWGEDEKNRSLFSDWGSYDFTVNPAHLRAFKKAKGYAMTSEDFVNAGEYNATHNVPTKKYREWMDFINEFVVNAGRQLIDIVHKYNKKAYVFYDDSWVGVEPYGKRFKDFNFDGIIKCVFNGFEARLCAGVKGVKTHELRFHPYLFPTGLTGEPTFSEGGHPEIEAGKYWIQVRRALLRAPVDRIGLGGYLHLVEPFPAFCDYIEKVGQEFRTLKQFNSACSPYTIKGKVAVLTSWGSLRSWICSGHLHEHPEVDLTNILESLAGLPFDVEFISFDDIAEKGIPSDVKVIINAGCANSAWSGGDNWKNDKVVSSITEFVANGGGFIGVHDPSATSFGGLYYQLSPVLGVDKDTGTKKCIGKYKAELAKTGEELSIVKDSGNAVSEIEATEGVYISDKNTVVLAEKNGTPTVTAHKFLKGRAVYIASWKFSFDVTRILFRAICYTMNATEKEQKEYVTTNIFTECAYYPDINKTVIINNSAENQKTSFENANGETISVELKPFETIIK